MKDRKGALFLTILAGVLWGTSFPTIKIGLEFVDPYMFVFLRMSLASALALLIVFLTKNLNVSLAKRETNLVFRTAEWGFLSNSICRYELYNGV